MCSILNAPNYPEMMEILLEYYHKDIATKISEKRLQHIFHRKKKDMAKKSLEEQVEPNLNLSEDENQR